MVRLLGNSTRRPDVSFYKNGRIDITAHVSRLLGINKGDVVDVFTDGMDYFLYVRIRNAEKSFGRHEAKCIPTNSSESCRNFRAYSKRLCNAILEKSNAEEKALLPIGETRFFDDVGCAVTIITQNNLSDE